MHVGLPAHGLAVERSPTDEDVARQFTDKDALQLLLEVQGGLEPSIGTGRTFALLCPLAQDPVVQLGVGDGFEGTLAIAIGAGEAVVVDKGVEAIRAPVPDVPDEGSVVEGLAVLLEEAVA